MNNDLWHDPTQHFTFDQSHVDELKAQEIPHISQPERYFAASPRRRGAGLREMLGQLPSGATIKLLPGGDHALSDFDQHLDEAGFF